MVTMVFLAIERMMEFIGKDKSPRIALAGCHGIADNLRRSLGAYPAGSNSTPDVIVLLWFSNHQETECFSLVNTEDPDTRCGTKSGDSEEWRSIVGGCTAYKLQPCYASVAVEFQNLMLNILEKCPVHDSCPPRKKPYSEEAKDKDPRCRLTWRYKYRCNNQDRSWKQKRNAIITENERRRHRERDRDQDQAWDRDFVMGQCT
ncbi:hypothetical protein EVAR_44597_1 [Eumeta japonica]|uniref:Uncharacterized protein n=1 Tax=Eumeta variegata TaxID=151549 RepID=A0A4C1XB79_EUMVA|nr:hypothetical protein EVAR_44597_1 [Eumeta japonica]